MTWHAPPGSAHASLHRRAREELVALHDHHAVGAADAQVVRACCVEIINPALDRAEMALDVSQTLCSLFALLSISSRPKNANQLNRCSCRFQSCSKIWNGKSSAYSVSKRCCICLISNYLSIIRIQ